MQNGRKILIISTEAWGPNFVSKHHYANYLSKKNTVYFLNPAVGFNRNPFGQIKLETKELTSSLFSITYVNLLPKLNDLPKSIQKLTYQKQADQIHSALGIEKFDIVWSFDPYRFWNLKVFKSIQHFYHTVDFHPSAQFENNCEESADYVFAVTDLIKDKLKNPASAHKIGHGADINGFKGKAEVEIPGKNNLKACYVGNFHNHIDYSILIRLADENPECDFILIGPTLNSNLSSGNKISTELLKELNSKKNLFFIGSVLPQLLMSYLSKTHINLVLFKKENEIIHCSPHKLMGYFYSGNITLSNYIDEHKNTAGDIIIMEQDQNKIPELFKQLVENLHDYNTKELKDLRRDYAISNSYQNKIDQIFALTQDELN